MAATSTAESDRVAPGADDAPDPEAMSLQALEESICVQAASAAAQMCRWLLMIAEFDRREGWAGWGILSCAHWLSWRCSVSPGTAREHLRVARALGELPRTRALFAAGELSYSKVRALTRVVTAASEEELVPVARTATASQLERIVRGYRAASGEGVRRFGKRSLAWSHDDDGMFCLRVRATPEEGAVILAAMRAAAAAADSPPADPSSAGGSSADGATGDGDPDTLYWQQAVDADALVAVCEGFVSCAATADSSGDDTTVVMVHVDADQLGVAGEDAAADDVDREHTGREGTGRDDVGGGDASSRDAGADGQKHDGQGRGGSCGPAAVPDHVGPRCRLAAGPGLEPETARRLGCDASLVAMFHKASGEVLRVGRKTRRISPALRRALYARDGGCRYPGCHRRRNLNAHHIRHWADGGPTNLENLILVCRRHHMLVHELGFRLALTADGGVRWQRPDGRLVPENLPATGADAVRAAVHAADKAAGLRYSRRTILPLWAGERCDLDHIVWVLLQPNIRTKQAARAAGHLKSEDIWAATATATATAAPSAAAKSAA